MSVLVDLLGRIQRHGETAKMMAFYLLILGWLGSGAAVISGWQVQGNVPKSDAASTFLFWHRLNGFVIVGLFGLLLALRLVQILRVSSWATLSHWREWNYLVREGQFSGWEATVYLVLGIVGLLLVLTQGYIGGHMVYRYGVV